jgi:uncharacterized repeat protein (TIGR03803 family)
MATDTNASLSLAHDRCWFRTAAVMAIVFALTVVLMQSAQAQTYTVLHNFTGGPGDGQSPLAGVTFDRAGNLYGTTLYGGTSTEYGLVFKLVRQQSGFVFNPLYSFKGTPDGSNPYAKITIGPDGGLYGTTDIGGAQNSGTVFKVTPPPTICKTVSCPWFESLLYQFGFSGDGGHPQSGLVFDQNGNMYGSSGDTICCGVVYQFTRSGSVWTKSTLHHFTGGTDGSAPQGDVIRDQAGNLYGVTYRGGTNNGGVVYQLVPDGSGWRENILHSFNSANDGINPMGGLVLDQAGNLYGTTTDGGPLGGGTAFMLSPSGNSWTSTVIYSFQRTGRGPLPNGGLTFDAAGNLYGATLYGGSSDVGSIFKLTPGGGGWTYTVLKDFTSDLHDGALPNGGIIFDANGNFYGTAAKGGTKGMGVVWKITP